MFIFPGLTRGLRGRFLMPRGVRGVLAAASIAAMPLAMGGRVAAQDATVLPPLTVEAPTIRVRPAGPASGNADATTVAQGVTSAGEPEGADDGSGISAGGIPAGQSGSAVSVLTAKDIEQRQIRTAADALEGMAGVTVTQSGTSGSQTAVRIRGAESKHTLVLVDGVEVNSPLDGAFDFSNVDASSIERIEVLRGPQSGLYGSGAIGGVILITTKSGRGPLALKLTSEIGSSRTAEGTAEVSGGTDRAWGALVVHGFRTDGFNIATNGSEKDGTNIQSFAARGGFSPSDVLKVEGSWLQHRTKADYDNGDFSVPQDATGYFSDALTRVGGVQATLDTFGHTWLHNVYVRGTSTERQDFTPQSFATYEQSLGTEFVYGYKSTLSIGGAASPVRHFLTGMVEQRRETFQEPTEKPDTYSRDRTSFVSELRGEYFKQLFLTGSVRRDVNSDTQDFTTWHTDASWLVTGTPLRVHASTGTGVKYPSFIDLYGIFAGFPFVPNPALKPETSFGWDAGTEVTFWQKKAAVDVTYFDNTARDKIALSGVQTVNLAGDSTRHGVELTGRVNLTPQLRLSAAYTRLIAQTPDGLQEVRRSPNSGSLGINYAFDQQRGNVHAEVVYTGSQRDTAFDPSFNPFLTTLDSYWLVNLAASYKVQQGMEVFGRINNLLDERYQNVYGYNASGGATVFAGIKLTFGGEDGIGAKPR